VLHLFALGELRLETDLGALLSKRRKPLVLLIYLARHRRRPVSRVELAALLWGERPDAKARQSLRQALLELHRLVGDRLLVTNETVRLITEDISLDADLFEQDVEAGRDREAIARWAGGFCEGAEDAGESAFRAWADVEGAGLRRRLTLAFERLLDDASRRGDGRESIAIARRWTTLAPLDEHAQMHLINALRREGQPVDALALHSSFVTRVRETLGVSPSRAFLQLARTLDQSARTPPAQPAIPAPDRGRYGSRRTTHAFVGRDSAFVALSSAWATARAGTPTTLIIRAERGMGATRLCDELVRWVRDADNAATVLRPDYSRPRLHDSPFPGAEAVLLPISESPALGGISPEMLAALNVVVPLVGHRFHDLPRLSDRSMPVIASGVRDAIDAVAEDNPVLVVVDRIDMVDASSRSLLLEATRQLNGGALVVLVTGPSDDELRLLLHALEGARSVESIELTPLTVSDVSELLQTDVDLRADDATTVAGALHQHTGGTPAYVIAMIDALVDDGALSKEAARHRSLALPSAEALPVPFVIKRAIEERRDEQSTDARRLFDAAAVYAFPISRDAAARLTGLSPAATAAAIEELVVARLLRSTGGDSYSVQPPIVARAAYELVPPLRREAFHAVAATLVPAPRFWRRRESQVRIAHHRRGANMPPTSRFDTRARVAIGLVALAAFVVVATLARRRGVESSHDASVAIFPFSVSGDPKLRFLEAGMVDLLSTSLDGAAGLRTIDPRAVIAATRRAPGSPTTAVGEARTIAATLGARFFVLGTVVGSGSRLEVSATMYSTDSDDAPETRASASGSSDGLFDVVDRVTAQLAVARGSPAGERLAQLAAVTTSSLEALKAYLEARNAYRANDLYAAIPAYQRAVAADSTFALAWYGLASAASWMLRPGLEQHAAQQAVRFDGHLSARDRMLMEGFEAYSRGAADSAERLATSIAEAYDDVEAWVLLGEVLYHHNFKRGRSATESRHAWERVLALDPHYWPALEHLAEVAALEGNARQADSLLARYEHSVGAEHMMVASRALRAYGFDDAPSRAAVGPQLASDRGFWLITSVWYVAVFGRDLDDAQRLAHMLVDPLRPPEQQGFGRVLLAHLALARGRWREARAELAIARAHSPADATENLLVLSLAPTLSTPKAELVEQRAELEKLPPPTDEPSTLPWPRTPNSLQPMIRAYLGGMSSARTGDLAGRERALAQLETIPDPTSSSALGRGFALSIRAEYERALGHSTLALNLLEQGARATPFVAAWTSGIVSQGYERYLRAELLHELKRDNEALRWYGTFGENSPYDLVYLAPSLFRQAQIYDARGEKALAVQRYTRFIELWKDCDAEFRPMTALAQQRLAALR
jgi:DNA-binding SARP family transcriptional activator/TolB-like protein/tetratricopeptide (TPR) repeat protein